MSTLFKTGPQDALLVLQAKINKLEKSGGGGGGGDLPHRDSSDLTFASRVFTAPAGIYEENATKTIALGSSYYTKDKIIYVKIRDKAGKQEGYCYGSDAFFMNYRAANNTTTTLAVPAVLCYRYTESALAATAGQYGVYGYSINSSGTLTIRRRYNSSYSMTINGTFAVDVYAIDPPATLFA